jgi:hypothetical protein
MRGAGAAVGFAIVFGAQAHAKPPPARIPARGAKPSPRTEARPKPSPRIDVRPAPPLPMLPSVARVRVEAARDRVVVVEEVSLPRGDWRSGGLDLYVAFGSPGTPIALDARLVAVPPDALESRPEDAGEPMTVEAATRRTPGAQLLLGPPQMAGVVVHVKEADLRRAYALGDLAALRIRSLLSPPAVDGRGARDVVVRLGVAGEAPLTLERLQVVSLEGRGWIKRAEARLCGPEAEDLPLAVGLVPKAERPVETAAAGAGEAVPSRGPPIAPVTAVRHASDDLCIRWWASR